MAESAMFYTGVLLWALGAILAILILDTAVQWLAWRLYKDIVGWPTICKAMRMYQDAQAKGED